MASSLAAAHGRLGNGRLGNGRLGTGHRLPLQNEILAAHGVAAGCRQEQIRDSAVGEPMVLGVDCRAIPEPVGRISQHPKKW